MNKFFVILGMAGIFLVCENTAFAYLDPGTGSMILQSIIGTFFFVGAGIGIFWNKIKAIFNGTNKKSDNE